MHDSRGFAYALEWAEYARSAYFATVVPAAQVLISSEVVFVTDPQVPMLEGNHAALARTTPDRAEALLDRIIQHYQACGLQPTVAISPNCMPDDWPQRLQARGFKPYGDPEHFLALKDSWYAEALPVPKNIAVREIGLDGLPDFSRVMVAAYEMPEEFVPVLAHNLTYINDLPGVHNYVAYVDGEPVGCMSLFSYAGYSALGSGGVLPGLRNTGAAIALAAQGYKDYRQDGSQTMTFQTVLPKMERMLRIAGCKRIFTRIYYTLE